MALRITCVALLAIGAASSTTATILRAHQVLVQPYTISIDYFTPDTIIVPRAEGASANTTTASPDSDQAGVQLNPDGTLNLTTWETATDRACKISLSGMSRSSNPSGTCICYNLPSLNTTNGVFQAEIRLYRISDPRAAFTGIQPADVRISVAYQGATVSPLKQAPRSGNVNTSLSARAPETPSLIQAYMLVGQIDKQQLSGNLTLSQLEILVMPTLTLSARNSTGSLTTTNVSLNEATFLTGVFSREHVQSDESAAQAAVDAQLAMLTAGTVAFVLPGVQILIFPVGLVITGAWLLIGLAAYGFGTLERFQHAEAYQRRQRLANGPTKTF